MVAPSGRSGASTRPESRGAPSERRERGDRGRRQRGRRRRRVQRQTEPTVAAGERLSSAHSASGGLSGNCTHPRQAKKHKKHPTSTRLLARRPQKKIHLAARSDRRARRASELLTNATDPAHAATRKPGEHPQHAPHPDLSPIFPLKYKTKQKSRSEPRTRRAFGAR